VPHSKSKRNITDLRYLETEKGYFNSLWQGMKSRNIPIDFKNRDHLLSLWNKQKKELGGFYCKYTGVKLTIIRSTGEGYKKSRPTNISVDRIDPRLHYTEKNIVFCSWEFNNKKKSVTPDDCKQIVRVYEEMNEN
jgi:hypothetical protein